MLGTFMFVHLSVRRRPVLCARHVMKRFVFNSLIILVFSRHPSGVFLISTAWNADELWNICDITVSRQWYKMGPSLRVILY